MFEKDWTAQGSCATVDPEIFFPEKGGSTRAAKTVCMRCPVRLPCLDEIMATELAGDTDAGVWGEPPPANVTSIAAAAKTREAA